jgi:hypothetical protein
VGLTITIVIALAAGGVWALALWRLRQRRAPIAAPKDAARVLRAYTAGRWDVVITEAPGCLDRPGTEDAPWRAALELALGHALVQRDRCAEAVGHLEIGLARQGALDAAAGSGRSTAAEAKMRHMLGYALASTGRPADARREYDRALATPGIDEDIRHRVTASLLALDTIT